jgi:opacity protein-like surface antigen
VWVVDNELRLGGGPLAPVSFSETKAWADPVIGARLRAAAWGRWIFVLTGDVGGFGVSSDLTWQVFGGVAYEISDRWSAKIGYRALGVDYTDGGFKYDVIMHGPLLGLGYKF